MDDPPISDIAYQRFLDTERLMGSRCAACEALYVPPRRVCVRCRGRDLAWTAVRGTGTVVAFTSIAIGPSFMSADGYGRDRPYCTAAVALDEGPRVVARLEGVDPSRPHEIALGMPVVACFIHREAKEGPRTCLAFEPSRPS